MRIASSAKLSTYAPHHMMPSPSDDHQIVAFLHLSPTSSFLSTKHLVQPSSRTTSVQTLELTVKMPSGLYAIRPLLQPRFPPLRQYPHLSGPQLRPNIKSPKLTFPYPTASTQVTTVKTTALAPPYSALGDPIS